MMQRHSSGGGAAASAPVLDIDGARATIRLNRPKHLNRLQPDDLDALLNLFDRIESDPAIRVLVLTGTGRAFSAGYDLGSIAERAANEREQTAGSAFEIVVNRSAGSTAASMAARPIWRWPAISVSASILARCSCRRRGSGCIITAAASGATCRGSASTPPRSCS
jgi:hypothetical protein